jgi:hypothetical protein
MPAIAKRSELSCGSWPKDGTHHSKPFWKGIGDAQNGNMSA